MSLMGGKDSKEEGWGKNELNRCFRESLGKEGRERRWGGKSEERRKFKKSEEWEERWGRSGQSGWCLWGVHLSVSSGISRDSFQSFSRSTHTWPFCITYHSLSPSPFLSDYPHQHHPHPPPVVILILWNNYSSWSFSKRSFGNFSGYKQQQEARRIRVGASSSSFSTSSAASSWLSCSSFKEIQSLQSSHHHQKLSLLSPYINSLQNFLQLLHSRYTPVVVIAVDTHHHQFVISKQE